jgi:inorganic pyrophosphatase
MRVREVSLVAFLVTAFGPSVAIAQSCWGVLPLDYPQPEAYPAEFHAVVEIPAGGTVKYEIDHATGRILVDRFIVAPVAYPANYGFVTGTLEGDGDPLDVLVWTREPVAPGAILRARAVGVLRMVDAGEQDTKILAVPADDVDARYAEVETLDGIGPWERERVTSFFRAYKEIPAGAEIGLRGIGDAAEARASLTAAREACRRSD